MPEDDFRASAASAPDGVAVERARSDFVDLLCRARLSISQGGYNTLMEVLATGVPGVVVPFAGGSETEQRSEEHTSELQSLMRISYAVFCLKKKKQEQADKSSQGHRKQIACSGDKHNYTP